MKAAPMNSTISAIRGALDSVSSSMSPPGTLLARTWPGRDLYFRSTRGAPPVDRDQAALDHHADALQQPDILQRIAGHGDEVAIAAGRDRADIGPAQRLRRPAGRRLDRLHRSHPV